MTDRHEGRSTAPWATSRRPRTPATTPSSGRAPPPTATQIGNVRSRSAERYAFDAHTGEAVNCCGGFDETTDGERDEVKRSGQICKYPFGTEKKDYKFWDGTLGQAVTTKFVKETEIDGLTVYEFKYEVPTHHGRHP